MFNSPSAHRYQLSRRGMLTMAGAALAAPVLARADDPPANFDLLAGRKLQGAGFYLRKIGTFEVAVVSDGTFPFAPPFPTFGQNVGEDKVKAALEREFIRYDNTLGHVNALLIKTGKDVVLVDTGCGNLFGPDTGKLPARLANAGVDPKDITALVVTHAHPDHVGGLLGERGADLFPNAQFFVHQDEEAFWTGANPDMSKSGVPDEARAGMIQGAQTVLKGISKRRTLLGDRMKIVEGVEAVAAPGHTPGHLGVMVTSGSDQLFYITDAIHQYAIMMPNPDFYVAFDTDREQGVKQRRAMLDRATADKLLVSGAHLPFPGFGHVRKNGPGFEWVPSVWEW